MLRPRAGRITFEGTEITGRPAYRVAQAGLGLVPEGRQIFPNLTVRENLVATARAGAGPANWTLDRVFQLFPGLAERRASYGNQLSGGEQQMLAIGRALMINPKLLILDEATEGLAPLVRAEIWRVLETLKRDGALARRAAFWYPRNGLPCREDGNTKPLPLSNARNSRRTASV